MPRQRQLSITLQRRDSKKAQAEAAKCHSESHLDVEARRQQDAQPKRMCVVQE